MLYFLCTEANYLTLRYTAAGIYFSKQKFYTGTISSASFVIDPQILWFFSIKKREKEHLVAVMSKQCIAAHGTLPYVGTSCIMT